MTHDEMIAVIQAHKAGKEVQYKVRGGSSGKWSRVPTVPQWNFAASDYRVKPEPMEVWVRVCGDGVGLAYTQKEVDMIQPDLHGLRKFREVVE